ncbi:MAG: Rpn family recombination-promoting nuclease/putative transposase [Clostridiales bacterium]|jgi:predicted transposase/invertase (TIGR01784 family)|nr:Rpn family recombination-promoting nuclease/putative transposase [Clostridiales bacterium]
MRRYLDPKNDIPFKRIFGEHPDLLISFLNALMPFKENQYIKSIEYLPAEHVPDNPAKKNSIVDVRCKDNYGRQFIVEMQMYWNASFTNRFFFNASKAYIKQLDRNENYNLLQPVYALAIINKTFDHKTTKHYHHYKMVNIEESKEVIEGFELVMIELPKFTPESLIEKKMAVLWLRFLKEIEDEKYIEPAPELIENEYIRQAIELCEEGRFTDAELYAYEKYWDIIRTENAVRDSDRLEGREEGREIGRKEGRLEGRKEGLAEGMEKGIEKGIEKGMEKGMEKGLREGKIEVAKKMLKRNCRTEDVVGDTGLSIEEVNELRKQINQ